MIHSVVRSVRKVNGGTHREGGGAVKFLYFDLTVDVWLGSLFVSERERPVGALFVVRSECNVSCWLCCRLFRWSFLDRLIALLLKMNSAV